MQVFKIFSSVFLSTTEIAALLEINDDDTQAVAVDVVFLPDAKEGDTDEDSDEEEDGPKDINHLGKGVLAQEAEMVRYNIQEELPDLTEEEEEEEEPQPGPSRPLLPDRPSKRARQGEGQSQAVPSSAVESTDMDNSQYTAPGSPHFLPREKNKDRTWTPDKPDIFGSAVPKFDQQPLKQLPPDCNTPYDFHKLFVPDDFVDKVVKLSREYAVRKDKPEVQHKLTHNNIRITHAIMYMTGYLTPANRKLYWQQREDTENILVRKAMPRNTFDEVIRHTYFVDKVTPDPTDRFWKVRPLFTQLNKTAKKYIKHPENVSVDEGMIKYFGPHPLKQFMRGKPVRFGYKVSFTCIL